MKNFILVATLSIFLTNCKGDDNTNTTQDREIFEVIGQWFFSRDNITTTGQNSVITNQSEWNQLLVLLATENYDLSSKTINFNQESILFIRDEPRPNRKYSIIVDKVLYTSTEVQVYIKKGESEYGPDTPSQPFCVAKISKTNLPVNFY